MFHIDGPSAVWSEFIGVTSKSTPIELEVNLLAYLFYPAVYAFFVANPLKEINVQGIKLPVIRRL